MPVLPLDVFWEKLAESRLLSADQISDVRAAYLAVMKDSNSQENQTALAAQWLVRQRVVTLWQAKELTKGNAGNFFMGDYRLLDKHENLRRESSTGYHRNKQIQIGYTKPKKRCLQNAHQLLPLRALR